MGLELKGHYENASGLISAESGQVRTGAPLVRLLLSWPELTDEQEAAISAEVRNAAGTVLISSTMIGDVEQVEEGFLVTVPLPEPLSSEQLLWVYLTSGELTASVPVRLKTGDPVIESLHAQAVVLTPTQLYFTLAFKVVGDLTGHRSQIHCRAGHSPDPTMPQHTWQSSPNPPFSDQFLQVEVNMEAPLVEEFVHLTVVAIDSWGNSTTHREAVPLKMLLTQPLPPSRLEYDHAVQEIANLLPVWTASRVRDYLALAHDPAYTMKGPDWNWLGELEDFAVPYDFTFPPVSQRLLSGLIGQHAASIRKQTESFARSLRVSRADTGAAGHVWRVDLPPETNSQSEQVLPTTPEAMVSEHWEMIPAASWQRVFPSEVSPVLVNGNSRLIAGQALGALTLRAECRVETNLGSIDHLTSPAWTTQQNLEAVTGTGNLGLVWRQRRGDNHDRYWQLGWGWLQDNFGIWVKRVVDGVETLLYRDMEPRFYPKNEVFTLEVRDQGNFIEVLAMEQPVIRIESPMEDPGHAGLWTQTSADGVEWKPFFGSVLLSGAAEERLIGVHNLTNLDGLVLKEVTNNLDLLEAAPTHLSCEPAQSPVNGIRWGREFDTDRLLIDADRSRHRVQWWCKGSQIIKGEDNIGEPLFRFWIWDPDSQARPLTDYVLTSCVMQRRWLWVLGYHQRTERARVFIVDPASPAPLLPECCLWCESSFELDTRGAATLARSKDSLEVFIQ